MRSRLGGNNDKAVEALSKEHPDFLPLCVVRGYAGIAFEEVCKININRVKQIL